MTVPGPVRRSRRRAWTWIVVLLTPVVLAAGALGGVGRHYSSQLLGVSHAADPYDLRVRAVSPSAVTLPLTDDSGRPGVFGLAWAGGAAVLGRVVGGGPDPGKRNGIAVRREVLAGARPPVGVPARLVTAVWESDPRIARDLAFRTVEVPGPLGPMPAWHLAGSEGTWVVMVHGRSGTRQEGLRILPTLHRLGLPVLDLSYRNDLGGPRGPDGFYHLGDTEWRDVEAGVRYAVGNGAGHVVLYGWSMGGAIVEAFLSRSPYADRISRVVLDAPVLDWRATLDLQAANHELPGFLTAVAERVVTWRIGIDWDDFDLDDSPDRIRIPTLLFHGTDDDTVPIGPARRLAQARPRLITYRELPRAGHTQAWNVDPPAYEAAVDRFLASS